MYMRNFFCYIIN